MPQFVRKTLVEISAVITPASGDGVPSAVTAELVYPAPGGGTSSATVNLSQADDVWTGAWDSSASAQGTVWWMLFSSGIPQTAAQGQFEIVANPANTV